MDTLRPGITADRVPTSRLTVAILSVAGRTAPAGRIRAGGRAHHAGSAVRARQRLVVAVLAADWARSARSRAGRARRPGNSPFGIQVVLIRPPSIT
jgi:hypothetical protein